MGLYLEIMLFVFLKFSTIYGEDLCPPSFCGGSILKLQYPFKLESQTPSNNCTYFNLNCNKNNTIVNLPHGGSFYVSNFDYIDRHMQLYDPDNCLMKRIMNFSLESSPLKARYYNNYTFYACPSNSTVFTYLKPIDCLSSPTNKTIATFEYDGDLMGVYRCSLIGNWLLPVQYYGSYDDSFMFLTWDATVCEACQEVDDPYPPPRDSGPKPIAKILALALSMPALILMAFSCCSVFCLHLVKMIGKRYEGDSAPTAAPTTIATPLPPPSAANNTGLDESKITACTELVVLSGSRDEGIPNANSTTCSICLENYGKKETISVISKCGHCFHASCIKQWLGKNGSCPVCRTSLSDIAL